MMTKTLLTVLILYCSTYSAFAQKPDSVFIDSDRIQFIYLTDSAPTIREYVFEENMKVDAREDFSADAYYTSQWERYPHRLFAYNDLNFNQNIDSTLIGNQLSDYVLFAPDRYAQMKGGFFTNGQEKKTFARCETNNSKQYTIDSLNIMLLFDASHYIEYKEHDYDINHQNMIVPLKGNRYFSDSILTLQPDTLNGDYNALLWSHQNIADVDTISINQKYGLYTLTGKEVIAAIYDSIYTDEMFVRAFQGGTVTIFDYMGNVVKHNLKRAHTAVYRYQVLDNNNRVYWVDRDGKEHQEYRYGVMSVDDILYPLPFNYVLTPPKRRGSGKKKNYHWVQFKYQYKHEKREQNEKLHSPKNIATATIEEFDRQLDMIELLESSGINTLMYEYDKERFPMFKEFYDNNFKYFRWSSMSGNNQLSNYDFDVHEIPHQYKNPMLVSGKSQFSASGDYNSLSGSWIIAKHKGKFGVIDIRDNGNIVLPFVYDKIEGNTTHLTLHKKGLQCHYPISDTPRYKKLAPLLLRQDFIRFTLPNGKEGWLLKNGEEFLDQ